MEAKEKPKDPNDPREYRAMENGASKLFALVSTITVITVGLGWSLYRSIGKADADVALSATLCVAWLIVLVHFVVKSFIPILNEYWRRNVRGYVVAHYTEGGRARCSDPFPRGHERLNVFLNAYPFVVLWPLGGWFRPPKAYWRARQSWWSAARDTRFQDTPVRVTDKNGSSLRFEKLEDAMSFIAVRLERAATQAFWHDSSDMPFSWLQILEGLSEDRDDARKDVALVERRREEGERGMASLIDSLCVATGNRPFDPERQLTERAVGIVVTVRRLVAERDAARGEVNRYKDGFLPAAVKDRDTARQERDEAADFVVRLAEMFKESSRLHDKLQALRIHERVREWLYFHRFPTAWETSVANAHQQHDADACALAEVRARLKDQEKRDRRRHGKGAATPAT